VSDFASGISKPVAGSPVTARYTIWLDPLLGFKPGPSRVYTGPIGNFSLSPFVFLPTAGELPSGTYWWIVLIDDDTDGRPAGDFSDFAVTAVR
jgi:hypothetical protein